MTHKPANISIFVIFVLLASSLLGLLTLLLSQKLLRYQGVAMGYYQSYYGAKAGLETLLALQAKRGPGFSHIVPNAFFLDNITCENCDIQASMRGRSPILQDQYRLSDECIDGFVIQPGQSRAIPLFYDDTQANMATLLTNHRDYTSIYSQLSQMYVNPLTRETQTTMTMGMFVLSEDMLLSDGSFLQEYVGPASQMFSRFANVFGAYASQHPSLLAPGLQHYLLLANTSTEPFHACVGVTSWYTDSYELAQDVVLLESRGQLGQYTVGLQAVLDSQIPQFLLQTYSER